MRPPWYLRCDIYGAILFLFCGRCTGKVFCVRSAWPQYGAGCGLCLKFQARETRIPSRLACGGGGGASRTAVRQRLYMTCNELPRRLPPVLPDDLTRPDPTLPYPTLPYPTLPYPTLPYPTLPFPTLPYPALSYPAGVTASTSCGDRASVREARDRPLQAATSAATAEASWSAGAGSHGFCCHLRFPNSQPAGPGTCAGCCCPFLLFPLFCWVRVTWFYVHAGRGVGMGMAVGSGYGCR